MTKAKCIEEVFEDVTPETEEQLDAACCRRIESQLDKWDLIGLGLCDQRVWQVLVAGKWFLTPRFCVHGDVASWDDDMDKHRMIVFLSEIRAVRFSPRQT